MQRKIIHIDMDCFYAAIEMRDNPELANKPIAVGGKPEERSVLCTCNYIARKFGVRSAMPSAYAMRLCPDLIILPVNMSKYRAASDIVQNIFHEYTHLIEPLSLDEAYLDVTNSPHCQGSATWIAKEIRQRIVDETQLTASAGVAPNKFLAKIASGWNKPNGQLVIRPTEIENFVRTLSVKELFGVGKVTAKKMADLGLNTCLDLQKLSLTQLTESFGKFGLQLYEQCRGIDNRAVVPDRLRKSLSVERTFLQDMPINDCFTPALTTLFNMLQERLQKYAPDRDIKNQVLKIKSSDFRSLSVERTTNRPDLNMFIHMLKEFSCREAKPIRLLGVGVHFHAEPGEALQQTLRIENPSC
jgi:DNA polymerase-4